MTRLKSAVLSSVSNCMSHHDAVGQGTISSIEDLRLANPLLHTGTSASALSQSACCMLDPALLHRIINYCGFWS